MICGFGLKEIQMNGQLHIMDLDCLILFYPKSWMKEWEKAEEESLDKEFIVHQR